MQIRFGTMLLSILCIQSYIPYSLELVKPEQGSYVYLQQSILRSFWVICFSVWTEIVIGEMLWGSVRRAYLAS